jgi:FAD synthetase
MGFGTFDRLHPGHLSYLRQLKALGDELVIVIARDRNVTAVKGRPPRHDETLRRQAVVETGLCDRVVLGDLYDFLKPLRDFQPAVIGLGYDQQTDTEALRTAFPRARVVRLEPFEPERYKSSLMK